LKTFAPVALDPAKLLTELNDLQRFLDDGTHRREREEIAPFFKPRTQLCAALGYANGAIAAPDLYAYELSLFGDFTADAASGDSRANAFTLIEFEDASPRSIFGGLPEGKTMKPWAPRFEHGFSQLVDWAWRLSTEGHRSDAFVRLFGASNPAIHLVLIAGRDADLRPEDIARLHWRAQNMTLGQYRISCFTFDGILASLKRRLILANAGAADGSPA
jgi:hypothetical protein